MRGIRIIVLVLLVLLFSRTNGSASEDESVAAQLSTLDGLNDQATTEDYFIWMEDGARVGHERCLRQVIGLNVVTRTWTYARWWHGGELVRGSMDYREIATRDGRPVSVSYGSRWPWSAKRVTGRLNGSLLTLQETRAGHTHQWTVQWPEDATAANQGLRLAVSDPSIQVGQTVVSKGFSLARNEFLTFKHTFIGEETVSDWRGEKHQARLFDRCMIDSAGDETKSKLWVDQAGNTLRFESSDKAFIKCSPEEAMADFVLEQKSTSAGPLVLPTSVSIPSKAESVTMVIAADVPLRADMLPEIRQQTVSDNPDGTLTVRYHYNFPVAPGAQMRGVQHNDSQINRLLQPMRLVQSNDPRIIAAAQEAVGTEQRALPASIMIAMWVRENVEYNALHPYESASDVIFHRKGTCVQMAILSAAMCRAAGIPARTVSGFTYGQGNDEQAAGFASHAWAQVYVDGEWIDLDPSMGFTAGRIILAVSDGDSMPRQPQLPGLKIVSVQVGPLLVFDDDDSGGFWNIVSRINAAETPEMMIAKVLSLLTILAVVIVPVVLLVRKRRARRSIVAGCRDLQ